MSDKINKALFDIGKINGLMYAFENTYLDIRTIPEDNEKGANMEYAFYAITDAMKTLNEDLEDLEREKAS